VDELSTIDDVNAARSICHRGVSLIATAHATSLPSLLTNYQLNPVLGGLREVTLGAEEVRVAGRSGRHSHRHAFGRPTTARTRVERRQPPCFQVIVELLGPTAWRIHWDAAESIDAVLAGDEPPAELRIFKDGRIFAKLEGASEGASA
jgi:hypothetical protein